MRTLETSRQFERDLKKAIKQGRNIKKLNEIITLLQSDEDLPARYRPHPLVGNWQGYHECHVAPDWLLIYKPIDDDFLRLARLGSHSELFKK